MPAKTADLLIDVVTRRIPRTGFDWSWKTQVIAPMYKAIAGSTTSTTDCAKP
ncbi:MAG: hypothetical protein R3E96_04050 [Planctomycetota bacterium]